MVNFAKRLYEKIRPTLKWVLPGLSTIGVVAALLVNAPKLYSTYVAKPVVDDPLLQADADEQGTISSFEERWATLKPFDPALLLRLAEIVRIQSANPGTDVAFPRVNDWDFGYAVDYYAQGDDEGILKTEWYSCVTPGPKRAICLQPPEYRRTHHIHRRDWKG